MKAKNNIKSILIIGIAGGLAHMTSQTLQKKYPQAKIFGVDSRDVKSSKKTKGIHYRKVRYTRNEFEKLFRNNKFDVVFHLGRVYTLSLAELFAVFEQKSVPFKIKELYTEVLIIETPAALDFESLQRRLGGVVQII